MSFLVLLVNCVLFFKGQSILTENCKLYSGWLNCEVCHGWFDHKVNWGLASVCPETKACLVCSARGSGEPAPEFGCPCPSSAVSSSDQEITPWWPSLCLRRLIKILGLVKHSIHLNSGYFCALSHIYMYTYWRLHILFYWHRSFWAWDVSAFRLSMHLREQDGKTGRVRLG